MDYDRDYDPMMRRLIAMFPQRPIGPETIAVYWEMLGDLDGAVFAQAVKVCGTTCKWFPTIAELRGAVQDLLERPRAWVPYDRREQLADGGTPTPKRIMARGERP